MVEGAQGRRLKRVEFERMLLDLETPLRLTAKRLCRNEADAKDLVQDTIELGLRHAETLQWDRNPRAWLTKSMHNLFIDNCRRATRRPHADIDILHLAQPKQEPRPEWSEITQKQVREAVGQLEPKFRQVYELSSFDGKSYNEIATTLCIPKATVGTRLRRARMRLQSLLTRATP